MSMIDAPIPIPHDNVGRDNSTWVVCAHTRLVTIFKFRFLFSYLLPLPWARVAYRGESIILEWGHRSSAEGASIEARGEAPQAPRWMGFLEVVSPLPNEGGVWGGVCIVHFWRLF